jgi:hypothetical protein
MSGASKRCHSEGGDPEECCTECGVYIVNDLIFCFFLLYGKVIKPTKPVFAIFTVLEES